MGYVAQCNGTSSDIVRHNFPLSPFLGFIREEGPNLTLFAPIFFGNNWSRVELGIFSWEGQLLYCSLYLKKCLNKRFFKKKFGGHGSHTPWL